jgi:nucleosome-remodeling factor subunit BPTF
MAAGTANPMCLFCFLLFICRLEKANAQVVTRSRSGSIAPKAVTDAATAAAVTGTTGKLEIVSGKATPEEIKEKMEQQLKMQRAAHQQKRALETLKMPSGQVLKVVPTTQQGKLILR